MTVSRPKTVEIYAYTGGNEIVNRLTEPDEELWVVNGKAGRRIVIVPPGSTAEDAWSAYAGRYIDEEDDS